MDFTLSEDQAMIRDAARDFLSEASDSTGVRAAMATETGFDPEVWQQIAELGWCGISVPEAHDGLGLGQVELALVGEQMGEHLLCAPFFATISLATNILRECASDEAAGQFLPGIAAGEITVTAPLPSVGGDWATEGVTAQTQDDGWRLDGHNLRVPNADAADWLFLFAEIDGGSELGLFAVATDANGLNVEGIETLDATRRFTRVDLSAVTARRCDAGNVQDGRRRATALARLAMAAEGVGAAQRCLDLSVSYTSERKQFGRAVGSFQAVKHRCAEMMVRTEAARSAVYGAAALAAGEPDTESLVRECAMARVAADDAAFYTAAEAIQLHGGVGFTWEYDPQLYFKRAQAARHWLGDANAVRAEIATDIMSTTAWM